MIEPGLCQRCVHRREVRTHRGSTFLLCQRSRFDPMFPRYPALPVLSCVGDEPAPAGAPSNPPRPKEGTG
jgi:hypothetical protein